MSIASHSDWTPELRMFARTQRRDGCELIKSPPPIRRGIAWLALYVIAGVAAIGGAVWAYCNRPYPKWRAF